jgi:hypothetical protein
MSFASGFFEPEKSGKGFSKEIKLGKQPLIGSRRW